MKQTQGSAGDESLASASSPSLSPILSQKPLPRGYTSGPFRGGGTFSDCPVFETPEGIVALHEAGHAVYCLYAGSKVTDVSIVADAHYLGYCAYSAIAPPVDTCALADSSYIERSLRRSLSGGAATLAIFDLATDGGPRSDRYWARRLIRAAYLANSAPEHLLLEHQQALIEFFSRERVRSELYLIAQVLLHKRRIPGQLVHDLLADGECGAEHPDLHDIRCDKRPHPSGMHVRAPAPGRTDPVVMWEGDPHPTRVRAASRSAASRRIIRVLDEKGRQ